eukprot:881621-Rhodomonas_salina.1
MSRVSSKSDPELSNWQGSSLPLSYVLSGSGSGLSATVFLCAVRYWYRAIALRFSYALSGTDIGWG